MSVNASNANIGFKAPDFNLMSVDNSYKSLQKEKGKFGTVIVFLCNHCPYVISIAERLTYEAQELKKIGINTIGIMSNDVSKYPEDSFENMKIFSNKYKFEFPYLLDEDQIVAREYSAICTPDFFGFNSNLLLQYRGRIDSGVMNNQDKNIKRELFNAMKMIKINNHGPEQQFNSFGCSIKWK